MSDRMLEINFSTTQLRDCFSRLLPRSANINFFTSELPGCGKSQQILRLAAHPIDKRGPD